MAELFVKLGYEVIAFDRYNPYNNWGWLENSEYVNEMQIILGDIRDFDSVFKASDGCNSIIHLAALIGIPYSYVSPLAYIRTNVEGTYNVLETSKIKNIEQVLITSTSETYGSAQYIPIDETHPISAQSPYASTKISADQLSLSYYKSFNTPVKIVRPFNTYGPRQSSRAIIPTIINQLLSKNKKIILGNLDPTRDLTYVDDLCLAFVEIFKCNDFFGDVVNVGSNSEISIKDILSKISLIMKTEYSIEQENIRKRPIKSEVNQLVCDNKKLLSKTNWDIKVNLDDGLKKTINWLKDNQSFYKSHLYHV